MASSYIKCRVLSISIQNIKRKSGSKGYIIISFGLTNRYWLYNYVSWYYLLSEYDKKIERQKWHNGWLEKRDDFEGVENDMGARFRRFDTGSLVKGLQTSRLGMPI